MSLRGPIDLSRLEEVCDNDKTAMMEILQIYQNATEPLMESLRISLEKSDLKLLKESAHKLKGSSANIGAQEMADLAKTMEMAAKEVNWPKANTCYPTIIQLFQKIKLFIATF